MKSSKNDSSSQAGPSTLMKERVRGDDDRLSSYLESIPDELFINIASRLDLPSLMSLETNRELRSRVSGIFLVIPLRSSHCKTSWTWWALSLYKGQTGARG
jgi:hypothetical protein